MATPHGENQREAIVETAYALFLDRGYENVKLKDIAKACDITPSLLQYYFPKRADIMVAIFYDLVVRCSKFVGGQVGKLPQTTSEDRDFVSLDAFYHIFYRILHKDNDRLLRMYTVVLYDATLLKGGTDLLWDASSGFIVPSRTYKSRVGAYAINGVMSQLVVLYLSDPLNNDLDALVTFALDMYYAQLDVTGQRREDVLDESHLVQESSEVQAFIEAETSR